MTPATTTHAHCVQSTLRHQSRQTRPRQPLLTRAAYTGALLLGCLAIQASHVSAAPSQKPLLSATKGAKPNVMLTLDNSSSMDWLYQTGYDVRKPGKPGYWWCRKPFYAKYDRYGRGIEGKAVAYKGEVCYFKKVGGGWGGAYVGNTRNTAEGRGKVGVYIVSPRYAPLNKAWYSMRASQVNKLYYDPRIEYKPRIDYDGSVKRNDVRFVDNQEWEPYLAGFRGLWGASGRPYRRGENISRAVFTYVRNCRSVTPRNAATISGCNFRNSDVVHVRPSVNSYTLPSDHQRSDCANGKNNICTFAEEARNIANWYTFYRVRVDALTTSLGLMLNEEFMDNKMRLGWHQINYRNRVPTTVKQPVRLYKTQGSDDDKKHMKDLYDWLYSRNFAGMRPQAGMTPLVRAAQTVGKYYESPQPWKNDPTSSARVDPRTDLSCRRSFHILLADGAWTEDTGSETQLRYRYSNEGSWNYVNKFDTNSSGEDISFSTPGGWEYKTKGETTAAGRKKYVPYPGNTKTPSYRSYTNTGLSDITGKYYWKKDLRSDLANDIKTSSENPANWQNVTTYTIGFGLESTTFKLGEIEDYKNCYLQHGYSTCKSRGKGSPFEKMNPIRLGLYGTKHWNIGVEQQRTDDFIRAGYTGGGKAFSVTTPDEIKQAFREIFAGIFSAAGKDAGVAVSSSSAAPSDFAGMYKYTVDYDTFRNSGDIVALRLDSAGETAANATPHWSANSTIKAYNQRKVYSISGKNSGFRFNPNGVDTRADVKAALGINSYGSADQTRFVNYLLGKPNVENPYGKLYRQRQTKVGAIVNSPPLYVGGRADMGYDKWGNVTGQNSYFTYLKNKKSRSASIYAATNAGVVHVLKAEDGEEKAAYMPRHAMPKLKKYADSVYDFEYVLDGPLTEADVYNTSGNTSGWEQHIFGTGGRAGKFFYSLRYPMTADRTPDADDYMWEVGESDFAGQGVQPGYVTNGGITGQADNRTWITVVNAGHFSSKPGLVVFNALTGDILKTIPVTGAGDGLSGVMTIVDSNQRIVGAYAGDARGNMWRFNLKGEASAWGLSYGGEALFTTPGKRPIYGAITYQNHPEKGTIVVFGTGMLLQDSDLENTDRQYVFGIWDPTEPGKADNTAKFNTIKARPLLQRQVSMTSSDSVSDSSGIASRKGMKYFKVKPVTEKETISWKKHKGWQLASATSGTGERFISDAFNVGPNVVISSVVISKSGEEESCEAAGGSPANYIYAVDAVTGRNKKAFDVNGNKSFEDYSVAYAPNGGFVRASILTELSSVNYYALTVTGDSGDYGGSEPSGVQKEALEARKRRITTSLTRGRIDGKAIDPCEETAAGYTGVYGTIAVGNECDQPASNNWRRSWRQIMEIPN